MKQYDYIPRSQFNVWVIFPKKSDLWWLRFLKKGYRHCFLILNDGDNWITYDPMSTFTEIIMHKFPRCFNLPRWFDNRGDKVVPAKIIRQTNIAPFGMYFCVEGVKRILGIQKFWILTPYQLYKYIKKLERI